MAADVSCRWDLIEMLAFCAAPRIGSYYLAYSDDLTPLQNFKSLPADLFAMPQSNGDIGLHYLNGEEAQFDVIGMVISSCLEAPPGFPK